MRLSEHIVRASHTALGHQQTDGSFPAGCNGPYRDPETPVRNTAHWLITLLRAHAISGELRFRDAAARAARYLTIPEARPHDASFVCRTTPHKDACNGLIGQAWVIEALVAASEHLGEERYRALARRVFELHPFDAAIGLWHRMHVDGQPGLIDMTFNHQLWFAAAGALLEDDPAGTVGRQVLRFLDRAHASHFQIARSGRVIHRIVEPRAEPARAGAARGPRGRLARSRRRADAVRREIGYHAYNLYGFALLQRRFPGHRLWRSRKLGAALRFAATDRYVRGLEHNEYAYPYNPVGFEVALALQVFPAARRATRGRRADAWWVERQLERGVAGAMADPATCAARLYEATRLRDVELRAR